MQIRLVQGDIVDQQVDAVVNAANNSLLGGGGVDGALLRAGGDVQMQGRLRLRETDWPDGLPTGQAAASEAGDLAARWVIHVVGPVHSTREDRSHLLVSCYREALRVADELGCRSVAFPAVSAGVYGWPMGDAARVAVHTVRATATRVEEARFVLFSAEAYTAFATALTA
ncbi:MAG TPA: O-acetyl-ADP-ribose deacetylase [Mycobacteriales bacterium]|nr:O-acetyl-ADP-ribose deacetylase [Mycobacteriales bacterium]